MKKLRSAAELEWLRKKVVGQRDPKRTCVVTSVGTCGQARGAAGVAQAIAAELNKDGLKDTVDFRATGCHGFPKGSCISM
jgi:hypothetical protein